MPDNRDEPSSPLGQIVSPENLVLLRKRDRAAILAGALIVVTALGAVTTLRGHPGYAMALAMLSIVVVAGLVFVVMRRSFEFGDLEADLHAQMAAARAVNGNWWQIVPAQDHPGLTYIALAISEVAERHAMHGITFDETGKRRARWSSDVVAVRTSTPVELYYLWRGTAYGTQAAEIVSGFGRLRFDSVGREQQPVEGEGAFTRGTTEELEFGTARAVDLVRFSDTESERLQRDPACLGELAMAAFERFGLERGRKLSESRSLAG